MNAVVPFFKEVIRTDDNATMEMVDVVANDFGKYITPIINNSTKSGGIFSRNCSIDFL